MERKLATIRTISEIIPIEGADSICQYKVDGWKVVDSIDKYNVGSLVCFLEIDSWVPTQLAPFLSKGKEPREYNGVKGERLRTVKLRGAISQGLLLEPTVEMITCAEENLDAWLGVTKWERPLNAGTAQQARGNFPSFLRKTDQERIQNIRGLSSHYGEKFEVSIKRDGSSMTVYLHEGVFGVCSRNLDLKELEGNAFWEMAKELGLEGKLREAQATKELCGASAAGIAIQGELTAPNIQSNYEKVSKPTFHCFNIFDIETQTYMMPALARVWCLANDIPYVDVIDDNFVLQHSVDDLLLMADGQGSSPDVKREGIVFKSQETNFSFKAISNYYLLKEK